ncbi:MAG: C4-type zinc ribbon domain-containing protein [Acidimicrobiales bacterium]|jgi:predicted  nucleic acid-binding Zn-ribbon protein
MAEPYDTLLRVQEFDTALDQLRHRIEALPERAALADVQSRRAAVAVAMAELQAQVDDLAGRQASLEERIAASAGRRRDLEERMRSGAVSAARDLQAMDHEVGQLADRQRSLEDEEILLMEEEEPLDVALAEQQELSAALDAEAARLRTIVSESEVEIRATIAAVEVDRAECATGLPADLAERYERLRSHLGGVGAARLVGDRCDGCHLTLPSVELERIHQLTEAEFATCPQCDRILVH